MSRIKWHIEKRRLNELKPYDKNPRIITEQGLNELKGSLDEIGMAQPININVDNTILSGHARYYQLNKEDANQVVDVYVPERQLTAKEEEAVIVRMNKNVAGKWDFDILANDFEIEDLKSWGFTDLELSLDDLNLEEEEEIYTRKIEAPVYEPKGERPELNALFKEDKTKELLNQIEKSEAPEEVKNFLKLAAHRHTVFDYKNIAEYYAHADKSIQELMENSALVIIDFEKAIENGFVRLTKGIKETYLHEE